MAFTVATDFDGTIHDQDNREPGRKMGKPFPGAKETLTRLRELGATIVIHTCRARPYKETVDGVDYEPGVKHVEDWLNFFEIPFDEVTAIKPLAMAYVDDKAIPFQGNWADIERELLSLYYLGVRNDA